MIAGVDEVGRGPLAGPVVACAVIMPPGSSARSPASMTRSNSSRAERERLAVKIRERAALHRDWRGVGSRDRPRSTSTTQQSSRCDALSARLGIAPHHVLVDGKPFRTLEIAHTAIVGGDDVCYTIACASIIAKVTRDRIMYALAATLSQLPVGSERRVRHAGPHRGSGVAWRHAAPPTVVHSGEAALARLWGSVDVSGGHWRTRRPARGRWRAVRRRGTNRCLMFAAATSTVERGLDLASGSLLGYTRGTF